MFGRFRFRTERWVVAAAPIASALAGAAIHSSPQEEESNTIDSQLAKTATRFSADQSVLPPATMHGDSALHLIHADVLVRHGHRTPVHAWPGIDASNGWHEGVGMTQAHPHADLTHTMNGDTISVYEGRKDLQFGALAIAGGQLTVQGAEQLTAVGRAMRNSYVGTLVASDVQHALAGGELYLRSTNTRRTVDSMRAALSGMYPDLSLSTSSALRLPLRSVGWDEEYLAPTVRPCPALAATFKAGRARFGTDNTAGSTVEYAACLSKADWDMHIAAAHLAELDVTRVGGTQYSLSSLRERVAGLTGTQASEVNFVRVRDVLVAAAADGQGFPDGWDEETVRAVEYAGTRQLLSFMEGSSGSNAEVTTALRLGIGRLVQEVTLRLDQAAFSHSLHCAAFGTPVPGSTKPASWSLPLWASQESFAALSDALGQQAYFPASTAGLTYVKGKDALGQGEGVVGRLPGPRLCVYSAHDSTLLPMLMALGAWDGAWPPFASTLAIELYSTAPSEHSITQTAAHHPGDGHRGHLVTSPAILEALASAASGEDVAVEAMALEAARTLTEGSASGAQPAGNGDDDDKDKARTDSSLVARAADAIEAAVVAVEHKAEAAAAAISSLFTASADKSMSALSTSVGGGGANLSPATRDTLDALLDAYIAVAADLAVIMEQAEGESSKESADGVNTVQGLTARRDAILMEIRAIMQAEAESDAIRTGQTPVFVPEAVAATTPIPVPAPADAEQVRVEALIAAEREHINRILHEEQTRTQTALAGSSQAVQDMRAVLAAVEQQLSNKVEDLREESRQAFTWAAAALNDVREDARAASSGVTAAAEAAAAALQHAREATDITSKAGEQVERAALAQALAVAETLRVHEVAASSQATVLNVSRRAEAAAASAQSAANDATAARAAADALTVVADNAAASAKMAAHHAVAAEAAAASGRDATAHASLDAGRAAEASISAAESLQAARKAAELAVASARAAEGSATVRAAELQVAAQRADLMAAVAASRADATRAIANAADIVRRAESEAAKAIAEAEATKAKAMADAEAASRSSLDAQLRSSVDRKDAERSAAEARTHANSVLAAAQADMSAALKSMRLQEEEAKQAVQQTLAAIRGELAASIAKAEHDASEARDLAMTARAAAHDAKAAADADVALAEAVAAEKSALALAVAQAEADAAVRYVAEIRKRAEAEAHAARAESRAMAAEALAETRRVAEEALLAQALAEELISEARRQIDEVKAEASAAQQAGAEARAAIEADARAAVAAAEEVKASAMKDLARARHQLEAEQVKVAQHQRIADTASQLASHRSVTRPASPSSASAAVVADARGRSEAAAAWLAAQLREAEEEVQAATASKAKSGAAKPAAAAVPPPAGPQDPYVRTLARLAEVEAMERARAIAEARLPAVLAAMHLRDTPVNRARAERYISTVGLDRALQADPHSHSAPPISKHAHEGSADAIVPLKVHGEQGYIARAKVVTTRTAALPVATPHSSTAAVHANEGDTSPNASAGSHVYVKLYAEAAKKQGLPVPKEEEPAAVTTAPAHAAVANKVVDSTGSKTVLDAAYLGTLLATSSAVHAVVVGDAAAALVAHTAPPQVHTASGEALYLSTVASTATPVDARMPRALAPAPAPTPSSAKDAPVHATGASAYEEKLVAATKALKAARASARASGLSTSAPLPVQAATHRVDGVTPSEEAYLQALSKRMEGAQAARAYSAGSVQGAASPSPDYFVRVVYNGRTLRLPGSGGSDLLPLPVFRALMAAYIPKDFLAECGVPVESSSAVGGKSVSWPPAAMVEGILPELATRFDRIGPSAVRAAHAQAPAAMDALAAAGEDIAFDTIESDPADARVAHSRTRKLE